MRFVRVTGRDNGQKIVPTTDLHLQYSHDAEEELRYLVLFKKITKVSNPEKKKGLVIAGLYVTREEFNRISEILLNDGEEIGQIGQTGLEQELIQGLKEVKDLMIKQAHDHPIEDLEI